MWLNGSLARLVQAFFEKKYGNVGLIALSRGKMRNVSRSSVPNSGIRQKESVQSPSMGRYTDLEQSESL